MPAYQGAAALGALPRKLTHFLRVNPFQTSALRKVDRRARKDRTSKSDVVRISAAKSADRGDRGIRREGPETRLAAERRCCRKTPCCRLPDIAKRPKTTRKVTSLFDHESAL